MVDKKQVDVDSYTPPTHTQHPPSPTHPLDSSAGLLPLVQSQAPSATSRTGGISPGLLIRLHLPRADLEGESVQSVRKKAERKAGPRKSNFLPRWRHLRFR